MSNQNNNYLNINEASNLLDVSTKTIRRRLIKSGIQPRYGKNRALLFTLADIDVLREASKNDFSTDTAAKMLSVSKDTLRKLELEGVIKPSLVSGNHRRYSASDIHDLQVEPRSINIPTPTPIQIKSVPVLYKSLHFDQKGFLATSLAFIVTFFVFVAGIKANERFGIAQKLGLNLPFTNSKVQLASGHSQGQVLQAAVGIPSFNINVVSSFLDNSVFNKDVEIKGNLTLDNALIVPSLQTTTTVTAGTNITAGGNLTVTGSSTLGTTGTGALTSSSITDSGTLNVSGASTLGTLTAGGTTLGTTTTGALTSSAITDSGALTVSGTSTLGALTAGATTLGTTSTGALTSGALTADSLTLTDTGTINVGGITGKPYNAFANSGQTPVNGGISSDNDVFIGGDLEVAGTIFGTFSGTLNPGLTNGSVLFQGPSGIAGDNTNFFWDDTNNRLGVGTAVPDSPLNVVSSLSSSGSKSANFTFQNTNTGAGVSVNGVSVTATGSTPSGGTNTSNLINLGATALGSNTFNGINFGSGFSNYVTGTNWTVTASGAETIASDLGVNGGNITTSALTGAIFNSTATTVNIGAGATSGVNIGNASGTTTTAGNLAVNGGTISTNQTTGNLFNTTATTLNIGGAATTALNIGNGNSAYTAINLGSGTGGNVINIAGTGATGADTINIGTGGTGADTVTIGNSASTTTVHLTKGASGNITLTGFNCTGFGNNGKLTTDASGNIQCANDISAAGAGTNYWQQNAEVLTPFNATLDLAVGGTATSSAKFQAYALETTAGNLETLTSNTITTGSVLSATASAITSGNMIKLGQGGNTNFTGNGLFMDFDNTGQGGIGFTGNFLKLNNANSTKLTISSTGLLTTIGGINVSGADSTIDTSSHNLSLNLGSDAVGDLYYRNSSGFLTRLPVGSLGQSLTVGASSVPTWVGGSGVSGSDGWWQRSSGVVAPVNITDDLTIGGIATSSAKFQAYGVESTAGNIASLTSNTITSGSVLSATASAITSGNIVKLGEGGNSNFTGNGIFMDFDNTGQGGIGFTGNFLQLNNAQSTKFMIKSNGNFVSFAGSHWRPTSDSTTALNIANAAGSPFVTFDTTNNRLGIGNTPGTALDVTGTGRFSSGLTLTTGALSLTSTSGTSSLTSTATSGDSFAFTNNSLNTASANLADFVFKNNNTAGAGLTTNGITVTATGSTPLSGTNTSNLLNLSATALGSNTFNGINFGTGLTNYINATNFTVTAAGAETLASDLAVNGNTTLGDASGDSVTSNASTWTFANDTNFVLSGGVNGLSFDTSTLSIDATNHRVGILDTSPSQAFVVGNGDLFQVDSSGNAKAPTLALGTAAIAPTDRTFSLTNSRAVTTTTQYGASIDQTFTGSPSVNTTDIGLYVPVTSNLTDTTISLSTNAIRGVNTLSTGNTIDSLFGIYGFAINSSATLAADTNVTATTSAGVIGQASNEAAGTITNQMGTRGIAFQNSTGTVTNNYGVHGQAYNSNATGTLTSDWGAYFNAFTNADGASIDTAYGVEGAMNELSTQSTGGITTGYGGYFLGQDATTTHGLYALGIQNTANTETFTNLYGAEADCQNNGANITITNCFGVRGGVTETLGTISNGYAGYFSSTSALATGFGVYANLTGASTTSYGLYSNVTGAGTTNYGLNLTVSGASTNWDIFHNSTTPNIGIANTGTLTWKDSAGNSLMTLADGGTTGNLTSTGNFNVNGTTTIGDASADTVTVNAAAWTLANATTLSNSSVTTTSVLTATASGITSGNILKLGEGGDQGFTGNGLYMDFDNTGGGGLAFTGNFVKFDNATTTKFTVSSAGTTSAAGVYTGTSGTNLRLQATGTTGGSSGTSSIYFLDSSGITKGRFDTGGQFGTGADGAMTITTATSKCDTAAGDFSTSLCKMTNITSAPSVGDFTATVGSTTGFAVGDEVLIDQMDGTGAGNYETHIVSGIDSSTVLRFQDPIQKTYQSTNAQIARIPQFTTLTINTGITFTPVAAWNGTTGGVFFFRAQNVAIGSSAILDMNGLGGAGGAAVSGASGGAQKDCGVAQALNGSAGGTGTAGNAGTGPGAGTASTNSTRGSGGTGGAGVARGGGGAGGAGGGAGGALGAAATNGTAGSAGGAGGVSGGAAGTAGSGGTADTAQGDANFTSLVMGSGGGSGSGASGGGSGGCDTVDGTSSRGGAGGTGGNGGAGGAGGGILVIEAASITNNGTIRSDGISGSSGTAGTGGGSGGRSGGSSVGAGGGGGGSGGGGGGGSGGSVLIKSNTSPGGTITVNGGSGGNNSGIVGGNGGGCSTGATDGGGGGGGVSGTGGTNNCSTAGADAATSSSGAGSDGTVGRTLTVTTQNYGVLHAGSVDTVNADLAEYYMTDDSSMRPGDVVSAESIPVVDDSGNTLPNKGVIRKTDSSYNTHLLGIISTDPGVTLGSIDGDTGKADNRAVALSGRVPVKIASDSAEIHIGDYLTSSTTAGRAMKANKAGYTVAKALEDWEPGDGNDTIMAFVNLGYYMGPMTADGYIDTGTSFVANNVKVNTTQSLIDRIFGINNTNTINTSTESAVLSASDSALPSSTSSGTLNIAEAFGKLTDRLETVENDITLLKTQSLTTNATSSGMLSNTSLLTTSDLVVSNGANIGSLSLSGNSLTSITGALSLQQGAFEISTDGTIKANDQIRGTQILTSGQNSIRVTKSWSSAPNSVVVTPAFNTKVWVTDNTKDGFTINVDIAPSQDQMIYWIALW